MSTLRIGGASSWKQFRKPWGSVETVGWGRDPWLTKFENPSCFHLGLVLRVRGFVSTLKKALYGVLAGALPWSHARAIAERICFLRICPCYWLSAISTPREVYRKELVSSTISHSVILSIVFVLSALAVPVRFHAVEG